MEKGIPLNAEKHIPIYKTTKETTEKLSPAHVNFEHLPSMCKKKINFLALYIYYTLAFMYYFFPHFNAIQVLHPQKGLL